MKVIFKEKDKQVIFTFANNWEKTIKPKELWVLFQEAKKQLKKSTFLNKK